MADLHKALSHHAQAGYALRQGDLATARHHMGLGHAALGEEEGDEGDPHEADEEGRGPGKFEGDEGHSRAAGPAGSRARSEMGGDKDIGGRGYKPDLVKKPVGGVRGGLSA